MISIIIPVYNEEAGISNFIKNLEEKTQDQEVEIIFVDGGSSDKTVEICKSFGKQVLVSEKPSRAKQMNAGAEKANGDILYFLHSDSMPPDDFLIDIQKAIEMGFSAGCYQLAFKPNQIFLDIFGWFTRFNLNLFRFGDQSLFVEKALFEKVGGFDEKLLVMEDQEIVRSLKKRGQFIVFKKKIVTSSRKYQKVGVLKLQLVFTLIVLMHYLGIKQSTITDFYRRYL